MLLVSPLPALRAQLAAGDAVDNAVDVGRPQGRRAVRRVPKLQQIVRHDWVDVPAQQVAGHLRDAAVACTFADTVAN